jgi:uncharacterized protein YyaL (SSP411 family)
MPGTPKTRRVAVALRVHNQVLVCGPAGVAAPAVPLLANRHVVNGKPAAYACHDLVCQMPVTSQQALEGLLSAY